MLSTSDQCLAAGDDYKGEVGAVRIELRLPMPSGIHSILLLHNIPNAVQTNREHFLLDLKSEAKKAPETRHGHTLACTLWLYRSGSF